MVELQLCPHKIARFRCDNSKEEYDNSAFRSILRESGITFEPSPLYAQHKNVSGCLPPRAIFMPVVRQQPMEGFLHTKSSTIASQRSHTCGASALCRTECCPLLHCRGSSGREPNPSTGLGTCMTLPPFGSSGIQSADLSSSYQTFVLMSLQNGRVAPALSSSVSKSAPIQIPEQILRPQMAVTSPRFTRRMVVQRLRPKTDKDSNRDTRRISRIQSDGRIQLRPHNSLAFGVTTAKENTQHESSSHATGQQATILSMGRSDKHRKPSTC